jgi:hypothetical protein
MPLSDQQRQLLHAIRETPEDRLTWLSLADHKEETGGPEQIVIAAALPPLTMRREVKETALYKKEGAPDARDE